MIDLLDFDAYLIALFLLLAAGCIALAVLDERGADK